MYVGIEWRTTRVNGKKYWRIAPLVIASDRQRLYLGVALVVSLFIFSIILLEASKP